MTIREPIPLADRALLTLDAAAAYLSISKRQLREFIDAGEIRVIRRGRIVRVRRSELDRWIEAQQEASDGT
jgi:excisionase family DNA binding protein